MRALALLAVFALSACQIAPTFDGLAFGHLVDASAGAVDNSDGCAALPAEKIHQAVVYPVLEANQSAAAMPHAQDFAKATDALLDMGKGLEKAYGPGKHPSEAFCEDALDQIHDGAQRILQGYGGAK